MLNLGTVLPVDHISYRAESKVKEILSPLSQIGDIHYFCYGVNYPDGSGYTLHTNTQYYESWFQHQFPLCGFFLESGWYTWDTILPEKQIQVGNELEIGNGVNFILHHSGKTEVFSFASKPDNKRIFEFYLNHQNLLRKFIQHFTESAKDIMTQADKERIFPTQSMMVKSQPNLMTPFSKEKISKLKEWLYFNSSPFNLLSAREEECFCYLIRGFSNLEIGRRLELSSKTVDVYVSRIKSKLKCDSKNELIKKACEYGLIDYQFDFEHLEN